MAPTQTITSTSIFSNPFRDSYNDPEAFGSYTTCQGPPPTPRTSPVAKFRKQITSALTPNPSQHKTSFFRYEPFDPDIVSLDFVPEARSATARAASPQPAARKISQASTRSNSYMLPERTSSLKMDPFDQDIVTLPFVPERTHTTARTRFALSVSPTVSKTFSASENLTRRLRHLPSRATIADTGGPPSTTDLLKEDTGRFPSTTDLLEDDMSDYILNTSKNRPATATGGDRFPPDGPGQHGAKGCRCHCSCAKCRSGSINLCNCACSYESCRCKSRKLPNKLLRIFAGTSDAGKKIKRG